MLINCLAMEITSIVFNTAQFLGRPIQRGGSLTSLEYSSPDLVLLRTGRPMRGCMELGETRNTRCFFSRDRNSSLVRFAAVTLAVLFALPWGTAAFCGEIHDAALNGDLAKIRALLKDHPDLVFSKGGNGETPLHVAAANGFVDVAQLLLAQRADVNAQDDDGRTPLHLAAQGGHKEVLELLLASKAEVIAEDNKGWTPLHFAASRGHKEVAEMLLADGAEVKAADASGDTPLHFAAFEGHADVAEMLLAHRAEVNAKDNEGWTPLHGAAQRGFEEVAHLLLAHKAKVNAKDNAGETALFFAVQYGHKDVAELLRKHGGHE